MKRKVLIRLALQNLRIRKKIYIILGIIIFLVSTGLISSQILYTNQYQTSKTQFNEENGSWYEMLINVGEDSVTQFKKSQDYSYLFAEIYGTTKDMEIIGHIQPQDFKVCGMHILDEVKPDNKEGIQVYVESDYFEKHHLVNNLNQTLSLDMTYENHKSNLDIKIIGTFEIKNPLNKKEFPSIVATQPIKGISHLTNVISEGKFNGDEETNIDFRRNVIKDGAFEIGVLGEYMDVVSVLNRMIICIGIGTIIILGVTYSSLKSRSKELTLLRGIGATKLQLFWIIIIECAMIYIISQILATLFAFLVSYSIMNIFDKSSYLYRVIYTDAFITGAWSGLFMALVGFVIPMTQTLKNSLTGAFDHQKFQYIQIRYRKLKKQNTTQLARRSLAYRKKFTLILVIASTATIYWVSAWQYTLQTEKMYKEAFYNDVIANINQAVTIQNSVHKIDQSVVKSLEKYSQNIQALPLCSIDTFDFGIDSNEENYYYGDFYVSTMPKSYIEKLDSKNYTGRFPENNQEVFLTKNFYEKHSKKENDFSTQYFSPVYESFEIGDTIVLKGKELKVVGVMKSREVSYMIGEMTTSYTFADLYNDTFFVYEDMYKQMTNESIYQIGYVRAFTNDKNYYDISKIMSQYSDMSGSGKRDDVEIIEMIKTDIENNYQSKIETQTNMSIVATIVALIVFVFMNYYDIANNKKSYAMLKILGATKKDIYMIQFKKALIMTSIASLISFVILLRDFNSSIFLYLIPVVITFFPALIMMSLLYILPMRSLFKQHPLDISGTEE